MKSNKTMLVQSLALVEVDGSAYVPTAVAFKDGGIVLGRRALAMADSGVPCFTDFKLSLGDHAPGKSRNEMLSCLGEERSAYEVSSAFISDMLGVGGVSFPEKRIIKELTKVIVAEPLSFQISGRSDSWISNYRENIKRILHGYGGVDFLPEPFAVYQYYRYGFNHPALHEKKKHVALIVDFGGGTFDASIVESAKSGDISRSGINSRPLSAASVPVGGFYINRILAKELLKETVGDVRSSDKKNIDIYFDKKHGGTSSFSVREEHFAVLDRHVGDLMRAIELAKIQLVSRISNWDLKSECYEGVDIDVPSDPFSRDSAYRKITLRAHVFRRLFRHEIWEKKLKKTIREVLDRAGDDLEKNPITVTLLSGGSANIKWLEKLMALDFSTEISSATPVPLLGSYQEIVAKGLAIECARRFYEKESEFCGVTYNPIRLAMDPDGRGIEFPKYSSVEQQVDMDSARSGDLMPSAQVLSKFIDHPLRWRAKLNSPPKHYLDYYFVRPDQSADGLSRDSIIASSYNIASTRVVTEKNTNFDSKIKIELSISSDGTARPKFIYRSENAAESKPEVFVEGAPFVLDATYDAVQNVEIKRYVGFDFGTSSSSMSILTNEHISWIESETSARTKWVDLVDYIDELPAPYADGIRRYLAKGNGVDGALVRDVFELGLTFLAYVLLAERISAGGDVSGVLKTLRHRSMGPLKGVIDSCVNFASSSTPICSKVKSFLGDSSWIGQIVTHLNEDKHDTGGLDLSLSRDGLSKLTALLRVVCEGYWFGGFRNLRRKGFGGRGYQADFYVAAGAYPYIGRISCSCDVDSSNEELFLLPRGGGEALRLSPFMYAVESADGVQMKYLCFDATRSAAGIPMYKVANSKEKIEVEAATSELDSLMSANPCSGKVHVHVEQSGDMA